MRGPHFPADDVGPLIDQNRQIAIALHPLRVARADDGFGGRPNDQWFGQRTGRDHFPFGIYLQPAVGDDRAFLGEAFHVGRFLREIAERNEKREIGVPVPGRLEHRVELTLHIFPDAVAPGPNHHAAADVGGLRHLGGANDLLIPFGKIFIAPRRDGGFGGGSLIGHARKRENYAWRNEMTSDHFSTRRRNFRRRRVISPNMKAKTPSSSFRP